MRNLGAKSWELTAASRGEERREGQQPWPPAFPCFSETKSRDRQPFRLLPNLAAAQP